MTTMPIRDVRLFVEVVGRGYPLALMHGGPGADHWTMLPFRQLQDRFTLVFYDHRCNGRSVGAPVTSMTWENLTADADALRQRLGFDKWALGEITVPTLVMAGRDDFVFPPEHQGQLAAGITNARLEIIERAGHNPHDERTAEVMEAVRGFIPTDVGVQGDDAMAVA